MLELLSAALAAVAPQAPVQVDYVVTIRDPAEGRVDVRATLRGLATDETALEVRMPPRYAFVEFPEPILAGPPAARAGERELAIERVEPYRWRIDTDGASELTLDWQIPLTHRDVPAVKGRDTYEHPFVAADHAMLVNGAIFISPWKPPFEARVRFELPAKWPVIAPWPEVEPGVFAPPSARDLDDGLIALGNWSVHALEAGGARVRIAFAPSEREFESLAAPLIERIVAAELALFGTKPFDEFVFLFTPSDIRGFGGSAKRGSMVLALQHGFPAAQLTEPLGHLVAHEFFHTWAAGRYESPDELRFVNEGFTDYFAYLVLASEGLTTWDDFTRTLAEKIKRYERGARASGKSLIVAGGPAFFEGRDAYEQVYAGGLLVAAACDAAIRAREGDADLAELMRAFVNDPRWNAGKIDPTRADFMAALAHFAAPELCAEIERALAAPSIDFVALLRAAGCSIDAKTAPAKLDLRANLDGTRILDLDAASVVAQLGLRAGDVFVEIDGRAVATEADVRTRFRELPAGRWRAKIKRGDELVSFDAEALATTHTIDAAAWRD